LIELGFMQSMTIAMAARRWSARWRDGRLVAPVQDRPDYGALEHEEAHHDLKSLTVEEKTRRRCVAIREDSCDGVNRR
jgi:hypothetical protein